MLAEAEASGAEGQGELWSMGPCVNDNWRHTHFLSLSGLCARVAHSGLLCSHQACLWPKLRPFKRQEASAGMWLSPMCLTTMWQLRVCAPGGKSALGWEELRRGSLGQPPGCVRTCSNRLPRWWKHGESAEEIQAATCRRGDCYSRAIFGRCLLFEEVGGGVAGSDCILC